MSLRCRSAHYAWAIMLSLVMFAAQAQAQTIQDPSRVRAEEGRLSLTFNRPVFVTGAVLFGGAYFSSLIYATNADYNSARSDLEIPLAGPWLDLSNRVCTVGPCDARHLNGALLVADGVAQGLGALVMLTGLLLPESTMRGWFARERSVALAPARLGAASLGASAVGSF